MARNTDLVAVWTEMPGTLEKEVSFRARRFRELDVLPGGRETLDISAIGRFMVGMLFGGEHDRAAQDVRRFWNMPRTKTQRDPNQGGLSVLGEGDVFGPTLERALFSTACDTNLWLESLAVSPTHPEAQLTILAKGQRGFHRATMVFSETDDGEVVQPIHTMHTLRGPIIKRMAELICDLPPLPDLPSNGSAENENGALPGAPRRIQDYDLAAPAGDTPEYKRESENAQALLSHGPGPSPNRHRKD